VRAGQPRDSASAKATFGEIDSHVHGDPGDWQDKIKTQGLSDLYAERNTWQPSTAD